MNATTGAVTATQLYAPYGAVRYQSGTLPGSHGYTGQHSDAATSGLDYYGARYYDPLAGQFTSADPLGSASIYQMRYGQQGASPAAPPAGSGGARQFGTPPDRTAEATTHTAAPTQHRTNSQAPVGGAVARGIATASSDPSARSTLRRDGLNLYSYVKGNPESHIDPTGMDTVGVCVSLGGGAGAGGFGQVCAQGGWSSSAGWSGGVTETAGGGGYAGYGGGVGIGLQGSTANSVNDLKGWFGYAGGGGTFGVGIDGDGFAGTDQRNRSVYGFDAVFSAGGDAHLMGGASYTNVTTFSDIWHDLRAPWEYAPISGDGGAYAKQVQDWMHQQIWSLIHQMTGHP